MPWWISPPGSLPVFKLNLPQMKYAIYSPQVSLFLFFQSQLLSISLNLNHHFFLSVFFTNTYKTLFLSVCWNHLFQSHLEKWLKPFCVLFRDSPWPKWLTSQPSAYRQTSANESSGTLLGSYFPLAIKGPGTFGDRSMLFTRQQGTWVGIRTRL